MTGHEDLDWPKLAGLDGQHQPLSVVDLHIKDVLEVSSPGVERPLRNAADWKRFIGRDAVVNAHPFEGSSGLGSKEIRIAGVEGDPGAEVIVVEDAKGSTLRVPLAAVTKARLAFNWKR